MKDGVRSVHELVVALITAKLVLAEHLDKPMSKELQKLISTKIQPAAVSATRAGFMSYLALHEKPDPGNKIRPLWPFHAMQRAYAQLRLNLLGGILVPEHTPVMHRNAPARIARFAHVVVPKAYIARCQCCIAQFGPEGVFWIIPQFNADDERFSDLGPFKTAKQAYARLRLDAS